MIIGSAFLDWIPSGIAAVATVAVVASGRYLVYRRTGAKSGSGAFRIQLLTVAVSIVGLLVVVLLLPDAIDTELAVSAFGLILTGLVAISSQSIVANAMAGLMLRSVRGFRAGDFIEVAGHTGRVSERGLFHTEIQTPDRDLVTLPNSLMVREPVKVIRSSGTIVSMTVSLGYDVPHAEVRHLLREAGLRADLEEPFVQVVELGDHAIEYRLGGFLADPANLLSARSDLRVAVLDRLAEASIEIVSPLHVARREVLEPVVPRPSHRTTAAEVPAAGVGVFDKAEAAEQVEMVRVDLEEAQRALADLEAERDGAEGEVREKLDLQIAGQQQKVDRLTEAVERLPDETLE